MNKKRYLLELEYHLSPLSQSVRDKIIGIYSEEFEAMERAGHSEEEAILLIGRAKANAEKELAIYADQIETNPSGFDSDESNDKATDQSMRSRQNQPLNIPMLVLLIVVNLIFVLGPALAILMVGLAMWFVAIVLMVTPLIAYWGGYLLTFPEFYPILAAVGLGILLFALMNYLTKLASQLVTIYFNGMNRMIRE